MRDFSRLKGDLLFRASSLPVPRNIYVPFINLVVKWAESSGEEWTIDRCKSIKLDLIRLRSGLEPVSSWIKHGRKSHFGGIIGAIERRALSSDKQFNSMIQLLQVYSWFIAKGVTQKQSQKFLAGVLAEPPPQDSIQLSNETIDLGFAKANLRKVNFMPNPKPLVEFLPSPTRRAPLLTGSVPEDKGVIDSLNYLWFSRKGRSHYQRFKKLYDYVMQGLDWWNTWLYKVSGPYGPMPNISEEFLVGRIGLIQEPGYKLRAVANPGRVFQRVLEPFGDTLYRLLKVLPWDCTFDQSKAIPAIQQKLSCGCVVHSIDLSGATDYFPLDVQEHLLRKLFPRQWVDIFLEISRGTWEMPGFGQVSWKRGQPLGLYPSFGAFALTHGCLLLGLLNKEYDSEFFILGDDVVILDEELAQRYRTLMGMLHCPISESKTILSSTLSEFGGKIITSNDVIPQYKWRTISDDSFIDICRNLGRRSRKLLRSRQRAVIDQISDLPECLGGFGWNESGRSLESRIQDHPWIFNPLEPRGRVTSYTGSSIKLLMKSESYCRTLRDTPNLVCSLRADLDQRSVALTKTYLSEPLVPWYRILGKNLDEVLTAQLLDCDLPIKSSRDQSSTLSQWERRLERKPQQVANLK
jgi:hypothetical protein